jgi:hypothetical protein
LLGARHLQGSDVESFFLFFASQSHHIYIYIYIKSFSGEVTDSGIFPFFFYFIRELNPHPPLALSLRPPICPYLSRRQAIIITLGANETTCRRQAIF